MCGILGAIVNNNSLNLLKNLYDIFTFQSARGIQGAGISINNKDLYRFRSVSPYRLFNVYNVQVWNKIKTGDRIMIHHRFPTSSPNKPEHNHPIANEDKTIHIIHNGVLYGYQSLFADLKKKGHKFETQEKNSDVFTDSEVALHLFEDALKSRKVPEALDCIYKKIDGSFALAISIKGDQRIYLVKHSNPIIISKDNDNNFYFSSEINKNNKSLKFVYELDQGEIGYLDKTGYKKLSKHEYVSYQSKIVQYGNNKLDFEKDEPLEEVIFPKKMVNFIKNTRDIIRNSEPDISYSKLCLFIFSDLAKEYPEVDIENYDIRIALREIIDK